MRGGALIARPRIGPGAATLFVFASLGAGGARTVGRGFESPVIAAGAIDTEFKVFRDRFVDAGAAYAGDAALVFHARRHVFLQPANRLDLLGARIGKRPGAATRVALAAQRALRRIAGFHDELVVIATRPIEADIGVSQTYGEAKHHTCASQ